MFSILTDGDRQPIGEIDGKTYYRVGTIADGNCMFHAWIEGMGKQSTKHKAAMFRQDTINMLKYDEQFQQSIVHGIQDVNMYKMSLELDLKVKGFNNITDILAYELQKQPNFASADLLPAIADKCNVDLYLLCDDGVKLQTQYHRTTTGERYAVILLNLGNFHYEYIVNEQWQTPHHPSSTLVRKLYQLLLKLRAEDKQH